MRNAPLLAPLLASLLALAACGGSDLTTPGNGGTPGDTTSIGGVTNVTVGYVSRTLVDAGTTYAFKVFVPANYNSASTVKVPVILYMHGSVEKGTNNTAQLTGGLGLVVTAQMASFPSIAVFPQSPPGEGPVGAIFDRIAFAALTAVLKEYTKADAARVYLTGISYGGIQAYDVLYQHPTTFAAFVPISASICGACLTGNPSATFAQGVAAAAQTLKTTPIWQFQGELDPAVATKNVRTLVQAFQAAGSPIRYTEYPGQGHEVWDQTYARADLWAWLYAQHR